MAVYVDELRGYGQAPKSGAERYFGNGKQSCHMIGDSVEELVSFAEGIGLRRAWLQTDVIPHFDLTPGKRMQAIRRGAVEIDMRTFGSKLLEHSRASRLPWQKDSSTTRKERLK